MPESRAGMPRSRAEMRCAARGRWRTVAAMYRANVTTTPGDPGVPH